MPPRHRHHGGFRGRRFGGPSEVVYATPVIYEESVILDTPSDLDRVIPPTDEPEFKAPQAGMTFFENDDDGDFLSTRHRHHYGRSHEAGDIGLPTFVTPEDAKRYMLEVDSGYGQLDVAIQAFPTAPNDFKMSWGLQLGTWKTFFSGAMATVGWLNTKAVMEQTDRFNQQLADWRKSFAAIGGKPTTPGPIGPGQGVPGSSTTTDVVKVAAAVGVVAAIIIFGPTLARSFSH